MTEPTPQYGNSARGITLKDVAYAADQLLRSGERPTVEKIRAKIGSGSPNTVGPLLDTWWKGLAARLDHGPAAFHRLPESVAHIAEALWLAALDQARRRAAIEQSVDRHLVSQEKERVEIRSHVLSLRESEMESRLSERDKTIADLQTRLQLLATALRREQAGRDELTRRLIAREAKPAAPAIKRVAPPKRRRLRQRMRSAARKPPLKSNKTRKKGRRARM
jgi:uncharacterized coiled-coil protein SlyX